MSKIAIAGLDIAIISLICLSLFSGRPAFVTSGEPADSSAPVALTR